MKQFTPVAVLALALVFGASAAAAAPWLHIHVDEGGDDPTTVRINVPVSLVKAVIPAIQAEEFSHGKIRIDGHDLDHIELREIWSALREAEDGEYITVESKDDNVRVAKEAGYLVIHVVESGRKGTTVDVRMPIPVVEALLSGEPDELDLLAAVEALGEVGEGELIVVNDDEDNTKVRIWIENR